MPPRSRKLILWALVATLAAEALTCALRFGLHRKSSRETAALARLTLGLRIHHCYLGVAVLIACAFVRAGRVRALLLVLGVALVASDLIHHFLVLWPLTGSPEFDLFYHD